MVLTPKTTTKYNFGTRSTCYASVKTESAPIVWRMENSKSTSLFIETVYREKGELEFKIAHWCYEEFKRSSTTTSHFRDEEIMSEA